MNPVVQLFRGVGSGSWLVVQGVRGIARDAIAPDALTGRRLGAAFGTYVWRPLPLLVALALLIGIAGGTVAARLLRLYAAELAVLPPLLQALARDVLPLVFGIFVSGRISVDLAARLSGTALAREVDALELLGHDPVRHLVSPPLLAVVAAVPLHLLAATAAAFLTIGWLVVDAGVSSWPTFSRIATDSATGGALGTGFAKALVFALIAFAVGAGTGSRGARGPADIGARATLAFTVGLLAIFAVATLWTVLS